MAQCPSCLTGSGGGTPALCPFCVLWPNAVQLLAQEPMAIEDAFLCAKVDRSELAEKAKDVAVKVYVKESVLAGMAPDDGEDIAGGVRRSARTGAQIRFVRGFKTYLLIHLSNLRRSRIFSGIDSKMTEACIAAVLKAANATTFEVAKLSAQGLGAIWIAFSDVSRGEDAALFSCAHEFGHAADRELRQIKALEVLQRIYPFKDLKAPSAYDNEYFADAFAVFFLRAAQVGASDIRAGAQEAFGDEDATPDHPAGIDRIVQIEKVLAA